MTPLQEFTITSWPVGGWVVCSSQTEQTYLQCGKCNQELNEVIEKEDRMALNLSERQKCPAVDIRHETGRRKNKHHFIKLSSRSVNNAESFLCSVQIQLFKLRRVKEEAQWIENSKPPEWIKRTNDKNRHHYCDSERYNIKS